MKKKQSTFKVFSENFIKNITTDPVSTSKGITQLLAAVVTIYGMIQKQVPINELSIGTATALITSGIYAIGLDNRHKSTEVK